MNRPQLNRLRKSWKSWEFKRWKRQKSWRMLKDRLAESIDTSLGAKQGIWAEFLIGPEQTETLLSQQESLKDCIKTRRQGKLRKPLMSILSLPRTAWGVSTDRNWRPISLGLLRNQLWNRRSMEQTISTISSSSKKRRDRRTSMLNRSVRQLSLRNQGWQEWIKQLRKEVRRIALFKRGFIKKLSWDKRGSKRMKSRVWWTSLVKDPKRKGRSISDLRLAQDPRN